MKKWIMMAAANWLRKPANRQKAKNAWDKYRGRNTGQQTPQQPQATPRNTTDRRPDDNIDHRP